MAGRRLTAGHKGTRPVRAAAVIRRPIRLLWLFLLAGLLASCSRPVLTDPPGTALATAGMEATQAVARASDAAASAAASPVPQVTLSITPSPPPTATETPTPTATLPPSPTPVPEAPALLPAANGASLALWLQPLTSVDTHITAGLAAEIDGLARYYFSSLDRVVYAYSADGQRRWKARMAGPVYALASLPGGEVAAGDDAGTVTLLDASGKRLWSHSLGTRVTALSGALEEGLLAGGWDQRLTLLAAAARDERVRWQADLESRVTGIAALPGVAIASTMAGDIRAFDAGGGSLWRFSAGAPVTRLGTSEFSGAAEGEQGVVLAGVQDGRLVALASDGALRWQVDLGEGSPVWRAVRLRAEDRPVIVAANGGATPEVSMLSVEGAWLWRLALPSPAGAVAVLDLDLDGSGEILVGLADGRILAYDGQGRLRATVQAGLPVWELLPGSSGLVSSGLVLADLNAWRLVAIAGAPVKPRLNVPGLAPLLATAVPPDAIPMAGGELPSSGAVLAFLGDVVPGRSMELQIERYGAGYPWAGIGHLLRDADLAMANLECVLSTRGTALEKLYVIRAHPDAVETLVEAGFDLVSLANNHTLDFGNGALDDTLSALRQANIAVVGAGRTLADARRAALFDLNGVRVAVLAYAGGYWQGSADMPESDLVAWSDPESVAQDVRAARGQADVVVVVLHAGKEYSRTPSTTQVTVAHAAIDAGAVLVVGHHPHVTQAVERYRGALIVYSLGNALFDIPLQSAMRGDLLRVLVTHEGLVQAELWPFWIDGEIQPRLLDDGQGLPRVEVIYP